MKKTPESVEERTSPKTAQQIANEVGNKNGEGLTWIEVGQFSPPLYRAEITDVALFNLLERAASLGIAEGHRRGLINLGEKMDDSYERGLENGRQELAKELEIRFLFEASEGRKNKEWVRPEAIEEMVFIIKETAKAAPNDLNQACGCETNENNPHLQKDHLVSPAADIPHFNYCCVCGRRSTKKSKITPKGVRFICSICENGKEATKTR